LSLSSESKDLGSTGDAYAIAGVDIDAANRTVERIKSVVRKTHGPGVLAGVGPFSALFALSEYRQPVLVSSTDGVGTKVMIARLLDRYDTVGQDLVNHCVNDILTSGASPLFFLDYLAGSRLSEDAKLALVEGMTAACSANGVALVGGETADMPGLYTDGDFDIAGFIVGVVERDRIIDGSSIEAGDVLLGLPSNGLHTNGYSLVRSAWHIDVHSDTAEGRAILQQNYPVLGEALGEALLRPHPSYLPQLRPVLDYLVGIAHITGGGLIENVPRILPAGLAARFDSCSWPRPAIFDLIQRQGDVADDDMFRTFNMGIGIVLVARPAVVGKIRELVPESMVIGSVESRAAGGPAVLID
jgi:phosphoribosylformylglycinamidine cyclo-ligase